MLKSRGTTGRLFGVRALAFAAVWLAAAAADGQSPVDCEPGPVEPQGGILPPAPDCNLNGVADACDIARGTSLDADTDGIPDECKVVVPVCELPAEQVGQAGIDCNRNGILDRCDIQSGRSQDADQDGVPDECPLAPPGCPVTPDQVGVTGIDCNRNALLDRCDIASGVSKDADQDGVPDECVVPPECPVPAEQVGAVLVDCNRNGILDRCDIRSGTSQDADQDGVPDECEPVIDDPVRIYAEIKTSAEALEAAGFIPRRTLDFLNDNKDALEGDLQLLRDAIAVTEFTTAGPADSGPGLGGGAAGGIIDGGFVFAISSQGHFVGAFYPQAVWNDGGDPCHRTISGHTYVGGVISGSCNSVQVGATFNESCGPTPTCPALTVDCAAIQVQCEQVIGTTVNQFHTPLEVLCAPCEVLTQIPGDCNGDGDVGLSDAICFLGHFFLATPPSLTCGDGRTSHPSNRALLDWNGDSRLDIADPISSLTWLFNGGPGHILGHACVAIPECPRDCSG